MQVSDFSYELPDELIARYPQAERTASRLLVLNSHTREIEHKHFTDLLSFLAPGDLLVFNDTRVIPARFFGYKTTGGKVEVLVERILGERRVLAHIRASKSPKAGARLWLENTVEVEVVGRAQDLFELTFHGSQTALEIMTRVGRIPLPSYMRRSAEEIDQVRYQTVYSRHEGAVAAPTAGLHFDNDLLEKLTGQGVDTAFITLHTGAGTFQPVRVNAIDEVVMHSEYTIVPEQTCAKVRAARARGQRVIAVGTTVIRSLETASQSGEITPYQGETALFIYPGYQFRSVDAIITNFHVPQSTLLMLTCAFGGYQQVMSAYQEAMSAQYRFFSYGDAMFITGFASAI